MEYLNAYTTTSFRVVFDAGYVSKRRPYPNIEQPPSWGKIDISGISQGIRQIDITIYGKQCGDHPSYPSK